MTLPTAGSGPGQDAPARLTVVITGNTQFIQKITLTKLIRAARGIGLKQARDEVDRLLEGEHLRFATDSLPKARALLQAVVAAGVTGFIVDAQGRQYPSPAVPRQHAAATSGDDSSGVVVGPTWVRWAQPGERGPIGQPEIGPDEAGKARRVLLACKQAVDEAAATNTASACTRQDEDAEAREEAAFTEALRTWFDSSDHDSLVAGRASVQSLPVFTEYGLYLALFEQGQVFAAIRYL